MLQRLPVALSLIKAGNISENVLYVIQKIIHFWYRAKEHNEFNKDIMQIGYHTYEF